MVIVPGGGHGSLVEVSQRYDMLMARLGWPDESVLEAVFLLDLVTAVETYRESAVRHIVTVEGTAAQLREVLGKVHPLEGAVLAGKSAQADQAVGAFMAASSLLEKFLTHHGVAE